MRDNDKVAATEGFERAIKRKCLALFEGASSSSLLIFGSYADGRADQFSDVDIVCILEAPPHNRLTVRHSERTIELLLFTDAQASARFRGHWKNNHVLSAFRWGRALHDPEGVLAALQAEAQRVWEVGPDPVSASLARRMQGTLERLVSAAELFHLRAQAQMMNESLARFQMDRLMFNAFLLATRAHGLWACPPWVLNHIPDSRYEPLTRIFQTYFDAGDSEIRYRCIEKIARLGKRRLARL